MNDIFVSHASTAGEQARAFLESLPAALRERGLTPFVDRDVLRPGDVWRPVLYRALARCRGAVLVLGPEALGKPWVLQEATILAWRGALRSYSGASMPVVTVMLDGVSRQDVERCFAALNLGDTQLVRLGDESLEDLAARVVTVFPVGRDRTDPLQTWTGRVARWLAGVDAYFIEALAEEFDLPTSDTHDTICESLADALLHHQGPVGDLEGKLLQLVSSRNDRVKDIVGHVVPVLIPAQTARVLLTAMRQQPGERVAAVNGSYQRLAELFVRRATCCDERVLLVEAPREMAESEEALYEEVCAAIVVGAGGGSMKGVKPTDLLRVGRPLVVVLQRMVPGDDADGIPRRVLPRLLDRLRRDFPNCVFLVLTGPQYDADLDMLVPAALRADPPLDPVAAMDYGWTVNRLLGDIENRVLA